jgi:hypothetical protein
VCLCSVDGVELLSKNANYECTARPGPADIAVAALCAGIYAVLHGTPLLSFGPGRATLGREHDDLSVHRRRARLFAAGTGLVARPAESRLGGVHVGHDADRALTASTGRATTGRAREDL